MARINADTYTFTLLAPLGIAYRQAGFATHRAAAQAADEYRREVLRAMGDTVKPRPSSLVSIEGHAVHCDGTCREFVRTSRGELDELFDLECGEIHRDVLVGAV